MWFLLSIIICVNIDIISSGFIQRRHVGTQVGLFYNSIDMFSSPGQSKETCAELNATCVNGCMACVCKEGDTFLSYKHGCQTYNNAKELFVDDNCFSSTEDPSYYPSTSNITFQKKNCHSLFPSQQLRDISNNKIDTVRTPCSASSIFVFDEIEGKFVMKFDNIGQKIFAVTYVFGDKCLQRSGELDTLDTLYGSLVKLNIDCELDSKPIKSCFIFKYTGRKKINSPTTTLYPVVPSNITKMPTNRQKNMTFSKATNVKTVEKEKSLDLIIIICSASVGFLLIVMAIIFIVILRKRNKKKKRRETADSILRRNGSNVYKEPLFPPETNGSTDLYQALQTTSDDGNTDYQVVGTMSPTELTNPRDKRGSVHELDNPLYRPHSHLYAEPK